MDFNIEPHFASVTEERMPDIWEAAKKADAFYGLYDESFLVEKGGSIQFFGRIADCASWCKTVCVQKVIMMACKVDDA